MLTRIIHDPPATTPYAPTIDALNDSSRAHRTKEVRLLAAEAVRLALVGAYGVSRRCFMNNPGSNVLSAEMALRVVMERARHTTAGLAAFVSGVLLLSSVACRGGGANVGDGPPVSSETGVGTPATAAPYPLGPEMLQLEKDLASEGYRATILSWRNHNDLNGEMGRADLPDNAARFSLEHGGVEGLSGTPALREAYERRLKVRKDFLALMRQAYQGLSKESLFEEMLASLESVEGTPRATPKTVSAPARIALIPAAEESHKHWPGWRGPSGQGLSAERSLPTEWNPESGIAWKVKVPGRGNSSPVVWGKKLFLLSAFEAGKRRSILCLRLTDGEILWIKEAPTVAPESLRMMKNGWASSTPVVDGERIVAFLGNTGLLACDLNGKQLWHVPLPLFDGTHGTAGVAGDVQRPGGSLPGAQPGEVRRRRGR